VRSIFTTTKQYQRAAWVATVGLILSVAIACVTVAASASSTTQVSVLPGKVVVSGLCPSEDSCSIDYTRNRTWVIRKVVP
jgi:hypothetical protein